MTQEQYFFYVRHEAPTVPVDENELPIVNVSLCSCSLGEIPSVVANPTTYSWISTRKEKELGPLLSQLVQAYLAVDANKAAILAVAMRIGVIGSIDDLDVLAKTTKLASPV